MRPAPKPVTRKMEDRFVELVGKHGLSYAEASRACEIGTSTGDRIATRRRKDIDALRGDPAADTPAGLLRAVFDDLLASEDDRVRAAGEALRFRYSVPLQDLPEVFFASPLPAGCIRYPQINYDLED